MPKNDMVLTTPPEGTVAFSPVSFTEKIKDLPGTDTSIDFQDTYGRNMVFTDPPEGTIPLVDPVASDGYVSDATISEGTEATFFDKVEKWWEEGVDFLKDPSKLRGEARDNLSIYYANKLKISPIDADKNLERLIKTDREMQALKRIGKDGSFAQGVLEGVTFGIYNQPEVFKREYPLPSVGGYVTGGVMSFILTGQVLGSLGLGASAVKAGESVSRINTTSKAAQVVFSAAPRFLPRAIMTGSIFATGSGLRTAVDQVRKGGIKPLTLGKEIMFSGTEGALLGASGQSVGISRRVSMAAAIGYIGSKARGQTNYEAAVAGSIYGGFELLGGAKTKDMKLKGDVLKNIRNKLLKYFQKKNPGMSSVESFMAANNYINNLAGPGGVKKALNTTPIKFLEKAAKHVDDMIFQLKGTKHLLPPKAKIKSSVLKSIDKEVIPAFKNTGDAIKYGQNATKVQAAALSRELGNLEKKTKDLTEQGKDEEAFHIISGQKQFVREALDTANKKIPTEDVMMENVDPEAVPESPEIIKKKNKSIAENIEKEGDLILRAQTELEKAPRAKMEAYGYIKEYVSEKNLHAYETNRFLNPIESNFSIEQLEVMSFIKEGTDVPPELNRPDLENIYKEQYEQLKPVADAIGKHLDRGFRYAQENINDFNANYIENYITHMWAVPKSQHNAVTSWFITQSKTHKKRYIETLKEGIQKFGLKPKILNIAELVRYHDQQVYRSIANKNFVEKMVRLKEGGIPLVARRDKAPRDWVIFDHPVLKKKIYIPGQQMIGEIVTPEMESLLAEMGVKIGRRINPKVFGKPHGVLGRYKPGDKTIHLRRFFSTKTFAHELGHHIHMNAGMPKDFASRHRDELLALNAERIERLKGYKEGYAESEEEMMAELFAFLFTDPKTAMKLAPSATTEAFEFLSKDGVLSKLVDFNFEAKTKALMKEKVGMLYPMSISIHPDLKRYFSAIFDSRITGMGTYEALNGVLKKSQLSFSLFHHVALTETSIATMGLKKTFEIWNPKNIYQALANGKYKAYEDHEIAKDAITHGVQIGATADIPVNKIQRSFDAFASKAKGFNLPAGKVAEFVASFNRTWDKALWNYYHDTLKIYAYETMVSKMPPDLNKSMVKEYKEEAAQIVNDTFGGQNSETLLISPKTLQIASWGLLSPDWTLSTTRQALSPTGVGAINKHSKFARGVRKELGTMFWIKAGLYFGVGVNLLNAAFVSHDKKKNPQKYKKDMTFFDYTMWGNDIGKKTRLFTGRYEDGSKRYLKWGKQFSEFPELFIHETGFNPILASKEKIGGKMAPALQLGSLIMTGSSLSGFEYRDIKDARGWEKVYEIFKQVAKTPIPFAAKKAISEDNEFYITDMAFPSSVGMSRSKTMEIMKEAIKSGDENLFIEVWSDAYENNQPVYDLFTASMATLKAEKTKEINDIIDGIEDVDDQIKNTENKADKKRLYRIKKRLISEQQQLNHSDKLLEAAIKKMRIEIEYDTF